MMFGKVTNMRVTTISMKGGSIAGIIRGINWKTQKDFGKNKKEYSSTNSDIIKSYRPLSESTWDRLSQISTNRTVH